MMDNARGQVFWFTGLSGTGKTTLADELQRRLMAQDLQVRVLDGDDVRERLHRHLGFSEADIKENNALIAELCAEARQHHDVVLVPIISPYRLSRSAAREALAPGFFEVYVTADVAVLEARDTKGLYARARHGEIENLIGYSAQSPYEPPLSPDITLETGEEDFEISISTLESFVISQLNGRR